MRTKLRSKVTLLFVVLGMLLAVPAVVLAAELVVAEVDTDTTVNKVVVEQGQSANFTLQLTATGAMDCTITSSAPSTAKIHTLYNVSNAGAVSSSTFSTAKNFYSNGVPLGMSDNCGVAWTGSPTAISVPAQVAAGATTPTGTYNASISAANGRTLITNPSVSGAKLSDDIAFGLVIEVVAASNTAPTADAGGPYTFDEGSDTNALSGSGSDNDGTIASYAWDLDYDGTTFNVNSTNQNPNFDATNIDGPDTRTVALKVTDDDGAESAIDTATVSIDNVAPTVAIDAISKPDGNPLGSVACLAGNPVSLDFSFTDPASADTHSASIDWGDNSTDTAIDPAVSPKENVEHTYNGLGPYTITVTVTDDDHSATVDGQGSANNSASPLSFHYNMSGILPPFNPDGTSTFKYGSTVPVKVKITDCAGTPVSGLSPKLGVRLFSPTTPVLGINEDVFSTSNADTGNTLRYDASAGQYIYNYNTKSNMTPDSTASYYMIVEEASSAPNPVSQKFGLKPK